METAPFLLDIGLALLVAAGLGWLARKLGLPAVVGYLAAGLVVSRFTPGYVADRHQIELLAEVGVVLLLFEVGIEVDLGRLRREHGGLLWASPVQIGVTTVIASAVLYGLGVAPLGAALVGVSVAMSSSVVVVNITRSRRRTTDKPTDEGLLGWSVLQDVTGVALATVILAVSGYGGRPLPLALGLLAAFGLLALAADQVLPRILRRLRSEHDLFLIVSVASGLVLFFVAVGSLIDPGSLPTAAPWIGLLVGLVVVAKVLVAWVLAKVARLEARPLQLAIGLGQMGEFGYVLAGVGLTANVVSNDVFTAVLASIVVTIAGSAILVRFAGKPPAPAETAPAASLRLGRPPSR